MECGMETAPLNEAHLLGRKAAKLLLKGLFSEASKYHNKSADLLDELRVKLPGDSLVTRSLFEQNKYHRRQAELALIFRAIEEKFVIAKKMAQKSKEVESNFRAANAAKPRIPQYDQIQKNFEEADSLLTILFKGSKDSDARVLKQTNVENNQNNFAVRPKNDSEVIEELQTVNTNLKSLVLTLLNDLQDVREENKVLKEKLQQYENNETHTRANATNANIEEMYEKLPVRTLPELTPLESPPDLPEEL